MRQGLKLLVLAGSAEARRIAMDAATAGAQVRALVSEPPRGPNPMPVPCDLFDFGTLDGVIARMEGADCVVDASHGFDGRMSQMGFAAAQALGIPFVSHCRALWPVEASRGMTAVPDTAAAVARLAVGARVFSATGWASLPAFATYTQGTIFLRQTTRHDRAVPYDHVQLVFGDPPFTAAQERATFTKLAIDTLVCRNLGGEASFPKVQAALDLGLDIVLITPPDVPADAQRVDSVAAALAWVARQ